MTADEFEAGFLALKSEVTKAIAPLEQLASGSEAQDGGTPARPAHAARAVQQVADAASAALQLPLQLLNTGFALATSQLSAMFPAYPAAIMGSFYVGPPHAHLHPPSLQPPAPPIPLPSFGPVLLGTCIKVLINGLPAARAGDIGIAVTCCGFVPAFEIKTGSSKVFIGGARAARAIDYCMECTPSAGAMDGLAKASLLVSTAGGVAGVIADVQDADDSSADGDAAMANAQLLSAEMGAKQLAMDAATMAIKQAMGKDVASPPMMGNIAIGSPKVLIGGFPMVNFPDPMQKLFAKLKKKFGKASRTKGEEAEEGCKTCGK